MVTSKYLNCNFFGKIFFSLKCSTLLSKKKKKKWETHEFFSNNLKKKLIFYINFKNAKSKGQLSIFCDDFCILYDSYCFLVMDAS